MVNGLLYGGLGPQRWPGLWTGRLNAPYQSRVEPAGSSREGCCEWCARKIRTADHRIYCMLGRNHLMHILAVLLQGNIRPLPNRLDERISFPVEEQHDLLPGLLWRRCFGRHRDRALPRSWSPSRRNVRRFPWYHRSSRWRRRSPRYPCERGKLRTDSRQRIVLVKNRNDHRYFRIRIQVVFATLPRVLISCSKYIDALSPFSFYVFLPGGDMANVPSL